MFCVFFSAKMSRDFEMFKAEYISNYKALKVRKYFTASSFLPCTFSLMYLFVYTFLIELRQIGHLAIPVSTYCLTSRSSLVRVLVCQPSSQGSITGISRSETDITRGTQSWLPSFNHLGL
jgi:hypothetical protein